MHALVPRSLLRHVARIKKLARERDCRRKPPSAAGAPNPAFPRHAKRRAAQNVTRHTYECLSLSEASPFETNFAKSSVCAALVSYPRHCGNVMRMRMNRPEPFLQRNAELDDGATRMTFCRTDRKRERIMRHEMREMAMPCHKPALSDTRLLLHCPPPYPAIRWERGMESEPEEKKRQIDEGRWHLRHVRAEEDRHGSRRRNLASRCHAYVWDPLAIN